MTSDPRRSVRSWVNAHRGTLRLRLTAIYGALFLVSGAALLAITYLLVARRPTGNLYVFTREPGPEVPAGRVLGSGPGSIPGLPSSDQVQAQIDRQAAAVLHQLLVQSTIALVITAVVSIVLAWFVAGRALRPLRDIADATGRISSTNLDERLSVQGPNDELRRLGETFNGLLGRLERSFVAQRQFAANASHELRTPLTLQRTMVEVALADPQADERSLRAACERVLASGEQQERVIEALLTLARGERGPRRHEPFDLADIVREALARCSEEIDRSGLTVEADLPSCHVTGDRFLVERLVANLVENAVRHNVPNGTVQISVRTGATTAEMPTDVPVVLLQVANSGRWVGASDVDRLLEPFERSEASRADHGGGMGLGLSIVRAVAAAHQASLKVVPRDGGGLEVAVGLPLQSAGAGS